MTLRNRVRPDGTIHADDARGTLTGNRGILHGSDRRLGVALWKHKAWICCTLDWQGRRRAVMTGRKWTELFFLDEAVALAAGHRPCGYCRRAAYGAFTAAWAEAEGRWPGAKAVDDALHAARAHPGARRLREHRVTAEGLPDGTFVRFEGVAHLLLDDRALPYRPDGYGKARRRPTGAVEVLTNPRTVAVLRAGYRPMVHVSPDG